MYSKRLRVGKRLDGDIQLRIGAEIAASMAEIRTFQ